MKVIGVGTPAGRRPGDSSVPSSVSKDGDTSVHDVSDVDAGRVRACAGVGRLSPHAEPPGTDHAVALIPLLPPALGKILAYHILPRLQLGAERSRLQPIEPAETLRGTLVVGDARYTMTPHPTLPQVEMERTGSDRQQSELSPKRLSVALTSHDGVPMIAVTDDGGSSATLGTERSGTTAVFEASPGHELWTLGLGGAPASALAAFVRAAPTRGEVPRDLSPEPGGAPFPAQLFTVVPVEAGDLRGYRVTNEVSANFTQPTLRGGAYLGIGASQNYDHITTVRAELAFLVDIDARVAQDHRGMLSLVGIARDPAHFLSMLAATPLTPQEARLPLPDLIRLLRQRPSDPRHAAATLEALTAAGVSPPDLQAAQKVMADARTEFLPKWGRQIADRSQHQWLSEPDRFAHLQFLERGGRIVVRQASIAGDDTIPSIARQVSIYNEAHAPPITFNTVYLSNAEYWIAKGISKDSRGYRGLVENMAALPLHPEGVILRTSEFAGFGNRNRKGDWDYMTLPMARYTVAAQRDPSYGGINAQVADADAVFQQSERERAQRLM